MIPKASPKRVLPSKMVESALASDSSDFKVSFSFEERGESGPLGDCEKLGDAHIFRETSVGNQS